MAKISTVIAIIIIITSSLILSVYLRFELPNTTADLSIPTLDGHVSVTQDEFGIYHIVADSQKSGLMAEGYLMARDRLWQMDFYRRQAEGSLAQIFYGFDKSTLDIDYSLRALGLYRIAERDWISFSNETQLFYQEFAEGVNLFIQNNANRLPVEFGILNYSPALWNPIDTIAILKLMAFGLNAHGGGEPIIGKALSIVNQSELLDLVKMTLDNNNITWSDPVAYPVIKQPVVKTSDDTNTASSPTSTQPDTNTSSFLDFLSSEFAMNSNFGSNNWVVSGERTVTGKPMLANDPHLALETPSRWWFVDLKTPEFHITGMTLPGIPGIVVGRNDYIMWGMTNSEIDYLDTYVETFNDNYTQYYYNNTWLNTTILSEKFYVSQSSYEMKNIYITTGNPLLNDTFSHGSRPIVPMIGLNTSIRWTAQDSSSAGQSLVDMIKSKSKQDFVNALKILNAPGENIVYADANGAIGLFVNGDIPIRKAGHGLAPHNGSLSTYEWQSFVPRNDLYQINQTTGYIATANNHFIPDNYSYFLGYAFDNNYRIDRINELLSENAAITYSYMENMQNDVYSLFAKDIVPLIIVPTSDSFIQTMEHALQNWDFNYFTNSTQGPLLALFTKYFLNFTVADEITTDLLNQLPITGKLTENLLKLPENSYWFNDNNTRTNETKTDMILKAYNAVKDYYATNKLNISTYTWGQLHKVSFAHILGTRLDFFNAGGLQASPGDKYTINVGTYNSNFVQNEGASMRQIMGMDSARTHLIVVPAGESGLVGSNHYADQLMNWLQGKYFLVKIEN